VTRPLWPEPMTIASYWLMRADLVALGEKAAVNDHVGRIDV